MVCELTTVFRADDELERFTLEGETMMEVALLLVIPLGFLERPMLDVEDIGVGVAKTNGVDVKLVETEAVELRGAANDELRGTVVDVEVMVTFAVVFEIRLLDRLNEVAVCEAETEAIIAFEVVLETRLLKGLNEVFGRKAETEALVDPFIRDTKVTRVWPGRIGEEATIRELSNI